jgi:hypothetical protein
MTETCIHVIYFHVYMKTIWLLKFKTNTKFQISSKYQLVERYTDILTSKYFNSLEVLSQSTLVGTIATSCIPELETY